jgi:mannose-1-phosphate guanylyltransferase
MLHVVVMAGGLGQRLWPMSRKKTPKQLLALITENSLLQDTVARVRGNVRPSEILVITNKAQVAEIRKQLPEVPPGNIVGEPIGRGSAAAIALAAVIIEEKDPQGIMIVLSADHVISPADRFWKALEAAAKTVEGNDTLATLGIVPEYPSTGFGYIHRGDLFAEREGIAVYSVKRFVEKPDLHNAAEYFRSGEYYWNAGIFIWHVSAIMQWFKRLMPDLHHAAREIQKSVKAGAKNLEIAIAEQYNTINSQTIDYGIMEKAKNIKVVEAAFQWDDVGSWQGLEKWRERDASGNIVNAEHIGIETHNCIIMGKGQLIATVGLDDIVIIRTDDAILVCQKERSQEVRDIVNMIKERKMEKYL